MVTSKMISALSLRTAYVSLLMALINLTYIRAEGRESEGSVIQEYTDCGSEDKIIYFDYVHATPMPVIVPGTLFVTVLGNVTMDLPRRVNVYLEIKKYIFGFPFTVPCFNGGLGSCTFENICRQLEQYEAVGCPKALRHFGIQCHCPFAAGHFNLTRLPINIPKISGLAKSLVNGDYLLELRINEEDGPELGCLRVNFSMKRRHKGWLFKI
ncbi:ganglioside GM2 activator-like [Biomphalaria glabrata]|uniref:Ganglioside GM2 activator-like n=2 Tax=Biomphalaria TaxID=6525 RepID=A0A9U8EDC8_BIOGL|nr:ganglioside GM2 activator-like [Biomphalaria glabrata]XP_055893125.1 ganglioside GM2 activator-like [Biomphalaria glabrata]